MAQRRKDMLATQTKNDLRALDTQLKQAPTSKEELKAAKGPSKHNSVAESTVISDAKPRRSRRAESRVKRNKKKEAELRARGESTLDSALKSTSARANRLSETERKAELAKAIKPTLTREIRKGKVRKVDAKESGVVRKGKVRKVNTKESGVSRKINGLVVRTIKGDSSPKRKEPASTISKTPGFDSLKDSLIGGSTKSRNNIEKADATKLEILRKAAVDIFASKANCFQPLPLNRLLYRTCRMALREFYSSELPLHCFYRHILILFQSGYLPASRS